ncbi:uncharacterized protein LOC125750948 isoform X2 [Brienomyrus brachyistius]|uniref:uncharacterized protein LOC125750948 isoform X2 n=1 Tax=Brienomyrus brachyistius TaxID=42636 RepID=UPI0020B42914|nr:uncharacterized protein LOC125750948 isoform X2 [Brienomyrus brachyistius]
MMIRIFVALILISETGLTMTNDIIQPKATVRVQPGENVVLNCNTTSDISFTSMIWFRHIVGTMPQVILASYTGSGYTSYEEINDKQRFTLQIEQNMFNLRISEAKTSDSGIYYCALFGYMLKLHIPTATFLLISGSNPKTHTVVQQPVSDTVQPGDSVSLRCTIETGSCAGEHSVYWFRHGSGESLPGVIYSHRNRSDECEKSPEAGSPTRSCVYSLPKGNLSLSDAGTYYCAVAMCGEMLFGNGTKINIEACDSEANHRNDLNTRDKSEQNHNPEMLNYAALHFTQKKPDGRRKKRETKQDSVYADVRLPG